jgi:tRNA threonylcarbamoyladenosine biosynthesis protein TsaB
MKLLAIDTSSTACSLALYFDDQIKMLHEHAPMRQTHLALSMLDTLLSSANIDIHQLDAIAFGCGPGSFTGIRIATGIAQGLGYALQIPLIPISSLAATAQAAYDDLGWEKCIVAIDARVQEIYWAKYQINPQGLMELIGKEQINSPEQIKLDENSSEWYGIGNAWEIFMNLKSIQLVTKDSFRIPKASAIIRLAIPQFQQQNWVSAAEAIPVYLRDEVAAKTNKR